MELPLSTLQCNWWPRTTHDSTNLLVILPIQLPKFIGCFKTCLRQTLTLFLNTTTRGRSRSALDVEFAELVSKLIHCTRDKR